MQIDAARSVSPCSGAMHHIDSRNHSSDRVKLGLVQIMFQVMSPWQMLFSNPVKVVNCILNPQAAKGPSWYFVKACESNSNSTWQADCCTYLGCTMQGKPRQA